MKLKITLSLSVVFLFYINLVQAQDTQGGLRFEKTLHDFGVSKEGVDQIKIFKFRNVTADTIHISWVTTACGCDVAHSNKEFIGPGEEGEIMYAYMSTGRIGTYNKTVIIHLNNIRSSVTVLYVKGVVIPVDTTKPVVKLRRPEIEIHDSLFNYGEVKDSTTVTQEIQIKNNGKDTLKITELLSADYNPVKYTLVSKKGEEVNYIMPGKTVTLKLVMNAPAYYGYYYERIITLVTNDPLHKLVPLKFMMYFKP